MGEETVSNQVRVRASADAADPAWDQFLRRARHGSFEQSGLWAQYKARDGWRPRRLVATDSASGICGGVQILWKSIGPARVGYVSKGPVVAEGGEALAAELARHVQREARALRLDALVLQGPDDDATVTGCFERLGFFRSNPMRVIEATCVADVRGDPESIRARMHRNVRRSVRQARERLTVTDGGAGDVDLFFDLMSASCRRHGAAPNPGSRGHLRDLWDRLAPVGAVQILIASFEGEPVAGHLNILWGRRLVLWKKGWSGKHGKLHPNEVLDDHALAWAHTHGFEMCDFCAIARSTALRALAGQPCVDGPDAFTLRFGGTPKLVQPPLLCIPSAPLRWALRPILRRLYGAK